MINSQISRKVLFIGNSYTAFNNLPQIIADVALSIGDTLIYDGNLPGGHTLLQHSTNPVSQSKIMMGGWHHVVIQGQSQEAITQEGNFYAGMTSLNSLIKQYNPCAVPVLYMTWGRKNGDSINCPNIPVMCTYDGMDTTIKRDYLILADMLRTEVSPVSVVWKYLRTNHPGIELYQSDESHPSAEGSYAAACSFYASIFKKNPAFITYNFGLNATDAAIIRNAAKINVFDSLSKWDYKKMPVSGFSYLMGPGVNEVIFSNTSQHADSYLWNFGDNTTSTLTSPTHTYAGNGTYTVSLTSSNCDLQGVHSHVTDTVISFCNHTPTVSPDTLMLCPNSSDTLWTQAGNSYQWYSNGVPIQGATNQYLLVSRAAQLIDYPFPSVLTTSAGCSELSKQSYVGSLGWMDNLLIGIDTQGNVINGDSVCMGETLTLTTFVFEEHITQWYKNGVAIPLANSDTLLVNTTGTYKVEIIHPLCASISGFSDSLHYQFIPCAVGLNEVHSSIFLNIFPNPVEDLLTVEFSTVIKKDRVQIVNAMGILVKEVEASENVKIDLSDFSEGLYFVRLKSNQRQVKKFVKQ